MFQRAVAPTQKERQEQELRAELRLIETGKAANEIPHNVLYHPRYHEPPVLEIQTTEPEPEEADPVLAMKQRLRAMFAADRKKNPEGYRAVEEGRPLKSFDWSRE